MTSKAPVRRNLFKIAENIERTLNFRNEKIYSQFSANFDGQKNVAKERRAVLRQPVKTVAKQLKISRANSPIDFAELKSDDELEKVTKSNFKSMVS